MKNLLKDIKKILKKQNPILHVALLIAGIILVKTGLEMANLDFWNKKAIEGNTNGNSLVLFYWKNCGHCKKMMPEWDKFSENHGTTLTVKKIEKDENPSLVKKHGISGFPTILLLDRAGNKIGSTNERTFNGLKQFAQKNQ